jgi:hypothetical protein
MRVVRELDEGCWKQFVGNHPSGNIFHTPEMFQVFARAAGHRPEVWAVVEDGSGILALIAPVHVTLMNGLMRRITTRSVAYGSVLYQDSPRGREAIRLLLESYSTDAKGRSLFTEFRNLSDLAGLQPLLKACGYVYEDHLNYLIDLDRPPDQVLQSIGRRTRKKIRKGLRDGRLRVSEVTHQADLAHWYAILRKSCENARVPLADRSLFQAAFEVLYPRGLAKFLLAKVRDVTVACSVELPYKDTIYGWYGGSDRAYSEYLPNEMLIWHILEWGARHGYHTYDFGGAGKPGEEYGVRNFKAKFGGRLVNFGRNTIGHAPLLAKISRLGYSVYRRLA